MMQKTSVFVGCLLALACLGCRPSTQTPETRVEQLDTRDAASFEQAGDAAVAAKAYEQAISFYEQAIELSPASSIELLDKVGRQWMSLGHPFEAMRVVESIVKQVPDDAAKRADLAGLQAALGLEYRAEEHLQYLVQHQRAGVNELIMLTDLTRPQTDKAMCEYALTHYHWKV